MAWRLMRAAVARTATDDGRDLLASILNELRAIHATLTAAITAQSNVGPRDEGPALDGLLLAASSAFGDAEFTSTELLDRALDADAELLAAVKGVVGKLRPGTAKSLGHRLARASKAVAKSGAMQVWRSGSDNRGSLWRIGTDHSGTLWTVSSFVKQSPK